MPALPNVPNVIKSIIKHGTNTGEELFNILFWEYAGTMTDAIIGDFASEVSSAWISRIMPLLSQDTALQEVEAIDLTSSTAPVGIDGTTQVGGESGDATPINCAMVISHEIARRYRGGHPRTYLGGIANSFLASANHWATADVGDVVAAFAEFVNDVGGFAESGVTIDAFVNVSYRSGGAIRVSPVVDPILNVAGRSRVCSQRRRLGKADA
jgi:hypothetical protein